MLSLAPLVFILGACATPGSQSTDASGKVTVIASFYPLQEFAQQVGGDRVTVRTLVPFGVEPHDWEPSPRDLVDIARAQVFLYNGSGFEPWVERVLSEVGEGIPVVVSATQGMDLLEAQDLVGRNQGGVDPHVWLDPLRAREQVGLIKQALQQADPENADLYEMNAISYAQRLEDLHHRYQEGLRDCRSRILLTSHAAFGYLADRYALTPLAISGLSPEVEPSPGRLAELVTIAREAGVRYIFFESLVSPAVAETLARELQAQTLVLNPIEGLTPKQEAAGDGYITRMEENLAHLREGLECA